jgi:hypothetical protein
MVGTYWWLSQAAILDGDSNGDPIHVCLIVGDEVKKKKVDIKEFV